MREWHERRTWEVWCQRGMVQSGDETGVYVCFCACVSVCCVHMPVFTFLFLFEVGREGGVILVGS